MWIGLEGKKYLTRYAILFSKFWENLLQILLRFPDLVRWVCLLHPLRFGPLSLFTSSVEIWSVLLHHVFFSEISTCCIILKTVMKRKAFSQFQCHVLEGRFLIEIVACSIAATVHDLSGNGLKKCPYESRTKLWENWWELISISASIYSDVYPTPTHNLVISENETAKWKRLRRCYVVNWRCYVAEKNAFDSSFAVFFRFGPTHPRVPYLWLFFYIKFNWIISISSGWDNIVIVGVFYML